MKNSFLIGLCVILIAIGAIGFLRMNQESGDAASTNESQMATSTADPNEPIWSPTTDGTDSLSAGGSSFSDPEGVYTFLYPNDYTLDTQNNGQYTRIYKQGPTQRGQTEMYDGVLMVFELIDLQGKSLEDWVDTRIQDSTADGTIEVTQPKTATTLQSYPGFTYEVRGLGSSTHLVVQKDGESNNAVDITFLVADPEGVGFQGEVDRVLSTLELHK